MMIFMQYHRQVLRLLLNYHERIDATIQFMKLSAKLIIEDEYDRKFLSLKAEDSKLEQYFWNAQVTEANNLEGETPILNLSLIHI